MIIYALPVIIAGVSIPLILGVVPPNGLYGFRTAKTLSSSRVWYAANRASGWCMLLAGLLAFGFNLVVGYLHPDWPLRKLDQWAVSAIITSLVLGVAASFIYLRRL